VEPLCVTKCMRNRETVTIEDAFTFVLTNDQFERTFQAQIQKRWQISVKDENYVDMTQFWILPLSYLYSYEAEVNLFVINIEEITEALLKRKEYQTKFLRKYWYLRLICDPNLFVQWLKKLQKAWTECMNTIYLYVLTV